MEEAQGDTGRSTAVAGATAPPRVDRVPRELTTSRARTCRRHHRATRTARLGPAADLTRTRRSSPTRPRSTCRTTCARAIEEAMAKYPDRRSASIPALHAAQAVHGWCSPTAIRQVAAVMQVTPAYLSSVASFYDHAQRGARRAQPRLRVHQRRVRDAARPKRVYDAIAEAGAATSRTPRSASSSASARATWRRWRRSTAATSARSTRATRPRSSTRSARAATPLPGPRARGLRLPAALGRTRVDMA